MKGNLESDYNKAVYTEGEFSIRIGTWKYFITHDPCDSADDGWMDGKPEGPRHGVAYDCTYEGVPITEGACRTCKTQYSKEMSGFMQLLLWEK